MNHPIMFLDRQNKAKLVLASFSYVLEFLRGKNTFFNFKRVIVIIVTISLYYKKAN